MKKYKTLNEYARIRFPKLRPTYDFICKNAVLIVFYVTEHRILRRMKI
jgi:hypothetical protein